jgi:2'-5' RNA ligase
MVVEFCMRAFIGIDFSEEFKQKLASFQMMLRNDAVKGRWKHRDNFHLTLKFFEEISPIQQKPVMEVMKKVCKETVPFSLGFGGLGFFEGRDSIRTVYLHLTRDTDQLIELHSKLDQALEAVGFPKEARKFTPHITLGQDIVFSSDKLELLKKFSAPIQKTSMVNKLILFKSEQIQNRRVYTKMYAEEFSGS